MVLAGFAILFFVWRFVARWCRSRGRGWFISHYVASSVACFLAVLFLALVLPGAKNTLPNADVKDASAQAKALPPHPVANAPESSADKNVEYDTSQVAQPRRWFVKDGPWLSCLSEKKLLKILSYADVGDEDAIRKDSLIALAQGDCTQLQTGDEVELKEVTHGGRLIKVRRLGDTKAYWTTTGALS